MKILMTGATGFIGSHTARCLVDAGHELRLLLRSSSDCSPLAGLKFESQPGDVTNMESLSRAMHGIDAVVHTAGCTSFLKKDEGKVWSVNVDGTRMVMEAAAANNITRVVYTSSVAAVGAGLSADALLNEATVWSSDAVANHYIKSKRTAEEVALSVANELGLDLVCVNPSVVLGPGDVHGSSTVLLMNWVKGRFPAYVAGGQGYVDVRDVATAHLRALEKGEAGRRYIINGKNLSNQAMVELCVRVAGARPLKQMPYAVAWLGALFNEWAASIRGQEAAFNRGTVRSGSAYWYYDNSKSVQDLGLKYCGLETSVTDTLCWAMEHGYLKPFSAQLKALS